VAAAGGMVAARRAGGAAPGSCAAHMAAAGARCGAAGQGRWVKVVPQRRRRARRGSSSAVRGGRVVQVVTSFRQAAGGGGMGVLVWQYAQVCGRGMCCSSGMCEMVGLHRIWRAAVQEDLLERRVAREREEGGACVAAPGCCIRHVRGGKEKERTVKFEQRKGGGQHIPLSETCLKGRNIMSSGVNEWWGVVRTTSSS